ncbi:MAG: hypothetical protein PVF70_09830 [Anaerolineales bacterium]|jgi:hypothetical protein
MTKDSDPFAFDQFPRGWLQFGVSRRQFLPALLENLKVEGEETSSFKLSELGTWPDKRLGQLIPQRAPNVRINLKDGWVYGQAPNSSTPFRLFPSNSPALSAFNQMNGKTRVSQIADVVAIENRWPGERAFAYVRGVFLYLVICRICMPLLPKEKADVPGE